MASAVFVYRQLRGCLPARARQLLVSAVACLYTADKAVYVLSPSCVLVTISFCPRLCAAQRGTIHLSTIDRTQVQFCAILPTPQVQAALAEDVRKLKSTFLEVLLSRAPSARS